METRRMTRKMIQEIEQAEALLNIPPVVESQEPTPMEIDVVEPQVPQDAVRDQTNVGQVPNEGQPDETPADPATTPGTEVKADGAEAGTVVDPNATPPEKPVAEEDPRMKEFLERGFGDLHRMILQGIMRAGFLDAKGVKKLFSESSKLLKITDDTTVSMQFAQRVVKEINEELKRFELAIRSASCELTGKKYYIFLILVEKDIMRFQSFFSNFELDMFKMSMDRILRKYANFAIPYTECINLTKKVGPNHTLHQGEEFVEKMLSLLYFAKYMITKVEFQISLGIRAIREFEPILKELYKDMIGKCEHCNQCLLHGYHCKNCGYLIHKSCYVRVVQTTKMCLNTNCKVTWSREREMMRRTRPENNPDSYLEDQEDPVSTAAAEKFNQLKINEDGEEDGDEEENGEEDEDGEEAEEGEEGEGEGHEEDAKEDAKEDEGQEEEEKEEEEEEIVQTRRGRGQGSRGIRGARSIRGSSRGRRGSGRRGRSRVADQQIQSYESYEEYDE